MFFRFIDNYIYIIKIYFLSDIYAVIKFGGFDMVFIYCGRIDM